MKNLKKLIRLNFISILILVSIVSCKTTETNIYTLPKENGQLVFLRPVFLDDKHFILREISFDLTVIIENFELTDNNTVNYTIHIPKQYSSQLDKVEFFFQTKEFEKILPTDISILYKDLDKNKDLEVRFSAKISKEGLASMVANPSEAKIGLSLDNQTQVFMSESFSQKLYELGVLIQ